MIVSPMGKIISTLFGCFGSFVTVSATTASYLRRYAKRGRNNLFGRFENARWQQFVDFAERNRHCHFMGVALFVTGPGALGRRQYKSIVVLDLNVDIGTPLVHGQGDTKDRKSTRLNSSHLGISYAVFC